MIDWKNFSSYVRWRWGTAASLKKEVPMSQSTLMAVWHGKSIGLAPYLGICRAAGLDPLVFYASS